MIWCVDDDKTILDIEVYTLQSLGLSARGFDSGAQLLQQLQKEKPALIVLDIMMPEMDGIQVLKHLRDDPETREIPVIMATAKGTEADKIQLLDSGADDYLVKPFGMMEMVSRVKAVLRRCGGELNVLQYGDICLKDREHLVTVCAEPVNLTVKEFALLKLFLKKPGAALSRDTLLSEVWGVDYLGESRTVDMHIKTLRQKLGPAGKYIRTVIGVGYRLEENDG